MVTIGQAQPGFEEEVESERLTVKDAKVILEINGKYSLVSSATIGIKGGKPRMRAAASAALSITDGSLYASTVEIGDTAVGAVNVEANALL